MQFIGREKQLNQLRKIVSNDINFSTVVIYGPSAAGKSLVLNHVLKEKSINYVYVNCRCICTVKQFFDVILNGIHTKFQNREETKSEFKSDAYKGWRQYSVHKQCTSSATFSHILQNEDFAGKKSFYIILDYFERLTSVQTDLISSLIQITDNETLSNATDGAKIGFVLIDHTSAMLSLKQQILRDKFSTNLFPIYFGQYSTKELQSILLQTTQSMFESHTHFSENERKLIIQTLLNTFGMESNKIDSFHRYLALLTPEFIRISNLKMSNKTQLIHRAIMALYHRVSQSQNLLLEYPNPTQGNTEQKRQQRSLLREPDLPFVSKLLILAAYLASFNSHKWNKKQLTNIAQKRTKRKKRTLAGHTQLSLSLRGAQTFTFRDLSGIFIELFKREAPAQYRGDLKHIHDTHSQIAHLISLSFISVASKKGTLDDLKFKCNVNHEFAKFIANKMGIKEWEKYLEDMQ